MDQNDGTQLEKQDELISTTAVINTLNNFHTIQNHHLRWLTNYLPYVIGAILLVDWIFDLRFIVTDFLRFPAYVAIIAEVLVLQNLFAKVPEMLLSLWQRGVIHLPDSDDPDITSKAFIRYINQFENTLNHTVGWGGATIAAFIAFLGLYPIRVLLSGGSFNFGQWATSPFFVIGPIIQIPTAFILGMLFWRFLVITYFIDRLGKQFELKTLLNHPDKSGGLKPLGDICLTNAFVVLVPVFLLAGWLILSQQPQYEIYHQLWGNLFSQALIIFSIISIGLFFRPLYRVHEQMVQQKHLIQRELDELSQRMASLNMELVTQSDSLSAEEQKAYHDKLAIMGDVYENSKKLPTWPFDTQIIIRLASAEIIPLLSLTGASGFFFDIIEPILSLISD